MEFAPCKFNQPVLCCSTGQKHIVLICLLVKKILSKGYWFSLRLPWGSGSRRDVI